MNNLLATGQLEGLTVLIALIRSGGSSVLAKGLLDSLAVSLLNALA